MSQTRRSDRQKLLGEFALRPLDTLSEESLAGLDVLLLAQPRALSPAENVALDTCLPGMMPGNLERFGIRIGGHDPLFEGPTGVPVGPGPG